LSNVKNRIKFLRKEEGQAIVELALAIPLLLIVLFGIIQFGEAINYYNDETNLANLAARYATVGANPSCNGSSSNVTTYISCQATNESSAFASGITTCVADPNYSSGTGTIPSGDPLQIKVRYPFPVLGNIPLLSQFFGGTTINLSSSATMRAETTLTVTTGNFINTATTSCP
jgi:Flp pilus assembly protein TadG